MAHLVSKTSIDMKETLKTFLPGEAALFPLRDVKDEHGNIIMQGSGHTTSSWDSRCRYLRKQGLLDGDFTFKNNKNPDGTIIVCVPRV